MSICILLADDHKLVRSGFRSLVEQQPDMEVVGEVDNGRAALELALQLVPDVIVMDVAMPQLNGIDATRQIVHDLPNTKVLALSMHPSQKVVAEMLKAGASGYLVKTCALEELVKAIRAVVAGKTYLSPDIAGSIVDNYVRYDPENAPANFTALSDREREVLQLVAEGKATKQIASILHVTVKTVETHRHRIMEKLDLHSIAELTKYAVREGLTPLDF